MTRSGRRGDVSGIAFQYAASAINIIAPVGSHCGHNPLAFALRSFNQSLTCVRGSSARENRRDTVGRWIFMLGMDGWMNGWMDRLLITTVDPLNVERIGQM